MQTKFDIINSIKAILSKLHPSESIEIIESIGKHLRRKNSVRINKGIPHTPLELERPDLESLKSKK
jgi:hypothetical protein